MQPLSREQVRNVDRYAIETLGVPGLVLMENAGRGCADRLCEMLGGEPAGKRVAVVAGGGNNGGDGYVIARHMKRRGAEVTIFLVAPEEKISGDAEVNLRICRSLEIDIRPARGEALDDLAGQLGAYDVIVDAVGGTGISGALRGDLARAVEQINAAAPDVLAVDIPTGLDCDTGSAEGPAVRAAVTVTFVAPKKGFDAPQAAAYTGKVYVADIGIPAEWVHQRAESD